MDMVSGLDNNGQRMLDVRGFAGYDSRSGGDSPTRQPLRLSGLWRGALDDAHHFGLTLGGEIDRLERIVSEFLQFARPAEPELKTMPADKLLQEIQNLLRSDLASRSIELKLELRADATIRVDSDKMKQVLINFIQNGADSMEKGGTVTLRLRQDRQLLNGKWVTAVIIDIADQGKGIPPEVQKRLFDPFFTTKEAGTGLGLPIAARIVEKHGGAIQYETQVNRGTTFSIVLPPVPTNET